MYCSQSFLGGRPTEKPYELQPCQADGVTGQEGLQVGDTVRVIATPCKGLVGELKVIDEPNDEAGDFFGIEFDGVDGYVFFNADEIERVERALDTYSADELKDYLRGLYAIPLREIDGNDRDQMRECKRLLHAMGWEFVFKGGSSIAFRKIRTEWKKWN